MANRVLHWAAALGLAAAAATGDDFNRTLWAQGLRLCATSVEDHAAKPMELEGKFPEWLEGTFYRNGPGKFEVAPGGQRVRSVFDGYGFVHGFKISGRRQSAIYSGRFLQTPRYQQLLKRGDMSYQGPIIMGTIPERKENIIPVWSSKGMNMGSEMSVAFIDLRANGSEHLLAVGEMPYGTEINTETLETIPGADQGSYFQYDDKMPEMGMGNAHPVLMPNGDLYSKSTLIPTTSMGMRTDYTVFRIPAGTTRREPVAKYSRWGMSMVYSHSFAVPSTKYAVLPFWPLSVGKLGSMRSINLYPNMNWDASQATELVVLDLETGASTKFVCDGNFFGFHFFHAWVDNSTGRLELVGDLTTQPDISTFTHLGLDDMRSGEAIDKQDVLGELRRIRIPLWSAWAEHSVAGGSSFSMLASSGVAQAERVALEKATVTVLSDRRIEVPRTNPAYYWNSAMRFVYGYTTTRANNVPNAIAKIDLHDGSSQLWTQPGDQFGAIMGEAIFIPTPGSTAEDDGVLVASGLHIRSQRGFLLVLNATTMVEIARAYTDTHLPYSFHATWLPADHGNVQGEVIVAEQLLV